MKDSFFLVSNFSKPVSGQAGWIPSYFPRDEPLETRVGEDRGVLERSPSFPSRAKLTKCRSCPATYSSSSTGKESKENMDITPVCPLLSSFSMDYGSNQQESLRYAFSSSSQVPSSLARYKDQRKATLWVSSEDRKNITRAQYATVPKKSPSLPRMVVVHRDAEPYAQLYFNQELGTLTTVVVGPHDAPLPLLAVRGDQVSGQRDIAGSTRCDFQPDPSFLDSMAFSSSFSSDESGWSTGNDDDTCTSTDGSDGLVAERFACVENQYIKSTTQPLRFPSQESSRELAGDEDEQSLLLGSSENSDSSDKSSSSSFRGSRAWYCSCFRIKEKKTNAPATAPGHNYRQGLPILGANLFRYVSLYD